MEHHSMTVVLRGTERYHMEDYLIKRGYSQEDSDSFVASDVQAIFEPQRKIFIGAIPITEVEVTFVGKSEKVHAEAAGLRFQFLTAGG